MSVRTVRLFLSKEDLWQVCTRDEGREAMFWYVPYYQFGKHHMSSTGTSDKKLAMEVLKKIEADSVRISHGLKPFEKLKSILLSEFTKVFLENCRKRNLSISTLHAYSYAFQQLLQFHGDRLLTTIGESQVQTFRNHLLTKVRPTSTNTIIRHLKAGFAWAVEGSSNRYMYSNPFKQKNLFLKIDDEHLPRSLSPKEKTRLFAVIDREDHRRFFQFLLLTGCRRGEALNLEWKNIDWG